MASANNKTPRRCNVRGHGTTRDKLMAHPNYTLTTAEIELFWAKVNRNGPISKYRPDLGPCWLWKPKPGAGGYGTFSISRDGKSRTLRAHRVAYQLCVGPFPEGLVPDHLCRVHACVNPSHLEPVTNRENVLRGIGVTARNASATHCANGHPFNDENTRIDRKGHRVCRVCAREHTRNWTPRRQRAGSCQDCGRYFEDLSAHRGRMHPRRKS